MRFVATAREYCPDGSVKDFEKAFMRVVQLKRGVSYLGRRRGSLPRGKAVCPVSVRNFPISVFCSTGGPETHLFSTEPGSTTRAVGRTRTCRWQSLPMNDEKAAEGPPCGMSNFEQISFRRSGSITRAHRGVASPKVRWLRPLPAGRAINVFVA